MQTQFTSKLKKGDEIIVISGKNKGQSGKIMDVLTGAGRVIIDGVNLMKRHVNARMAMKLQREPGVMQKEGSIAISNIMLKDPKTGKPTRVGYRVEADGSKVRVAKASGTVIDTVKKASAPKAKAKTATKTKSK